MQFGDRRIHRDRDLFARHVAGGPDRRHQQLQRLLVGLEVGREATLVTDGRAVAAVVQRRLQVVEHLGPDPQRLRERPATDRDDHELLEVDRVVGVGAAVEDVHHRDRQDVRGLAAEIAPQRQPLLRRRRMGGGKRHGENRVGAQPRLVRRAVERDQHPVERRLAGGVLTAHRGRDLAVDVVDRAGDALAHPVRATVAQLGRLELAGRGARRDGRPPPRPRAHAELDFHRGVTAAVEDLAGVNMLDLTHCEGGSPWFKRALA